MDTEARGDERHPGPLELLPILPIVLGVAWIVRSYEIYPWVSMQSSLLIAFAGASLLGLPALFWALDHGHRGLIPLTTLGALVGATPLMLIVGSAVAGLMIRIGPERTWHMLQRGAPIPAMGTMPWMTFARAELPAMVTGAVSAAIYWLLIVWMKKKAGSR